MTASDWIILGSSRTAEAGFEAALRMAPKAKIASANAGLMMLRDYREVPAIVVVLDEYAVRLFRPDFEWAHEAGARFVTYHWSGVKAALGWSDVEEIVVSMDEDSRYDIDVFTNANFSGLFALQLVMREKPRRVILAGMDGYDGRYHYYDHADTFDGRRGPWHGALATSQIIEPFMRSMVAAHPEIDFIQLGEPHYTVSAPNYRSEPHGARSDREGHRGQGRPEARRGAHLLGCER